MKDYKNLKLAYIGGGSRAWARNLMGDLAKEGEIAGEVRLYDIDAESAKENAIIGNALSKRDDVKGKWQYNVYDSLDSCLYGVDFVIISILPGTFKEMASDVHAPEKYGIYQSVGDSSGPGGIVRALRTIPMFKVIAEAIKQNCPNAWVINFTNPMTVCVNTLYKVFPKIKAFGCCHEVFATQKLFARILEELRGIKATRDDIDVNVLGINHFTFVDKAHYKNIDLFPLLDEYIKKGGAENNGADENWANKNFISHNKVKFDLYKRYGVLGAAGDRHLAEFCPGKWYLESPEKVKEYGFALTTVDWRIEDLNKKIEKTKELLAGKEFEIIDTGEESVRQIKALLGLSNFVTNVNIPNVGQMENLKLGAVVETNAYFSGDSVLPVHAGHLPEPVSARVERIVHCQEMTVEAGLTGNYELAFNAFINDPNVCLSMEDARKLFDEMLYNTKEYLPFYDKYIESRNISKE